MREDLTLSHSEFRAQAVRVHGQLLAVLSELGQAPEAGAWRVLEAALLDHLRSEEELLLPDFDLSCPNDAARVRAEHQRVRELLATMNGTLHEKAPEPQALSALSASFEECISVEEHGLYPWAEQCLGPAKKGEFLLRMRRLAERSSTS